MPHAAVDPTSLWWQQDTDGPPAAGPLQGEAVADVVVVGAGIVGTTIATDLAVAGHDVVLLEAGRVGAGATGHTSAKATALQSPRYARIRDEHGPDAARAYARLSLDAVDRIRTDAGQFGSQRVRDAQALTWTHEPGTVEDLEAEADAARDAGLPVRTVHTHERFDLAVGLQLDDQFQFDPLEHLRGLFARGLAAGLRLHEGTAVTGVSMTGDERTVVTPLGTVRTSRVVVATGLPVLDRGGWFALLEPERSYVVVLRGGEVPDEMGLREGGSTRSSRSVTTPDGEELLLVAGAGHRVGRGGDTRRHPADLRAWASLVFGADELVSSWSAQDWHPADGLPLAGPLVPGDDRVLAAGGFSKWGLTSGTAAAATLVRRVTGAPLTDVDRVLDPARLPSGRAARRIASTNATVGWSLASGWLRALGTRSEAAPAEGEGSVGRRGLSPVATSTVDGRTRSCAAVCTHLGGIVTWDPEGRTWACALHGSRFAPDGRVLAGPATTPLRDADA